MTISDSLRSGATGVLGVGAPNTPLSSQTFGQTQINVLQLIEYAFRDCQKLAESQSPQYINAAQQSLHYILRNLSNKNVNLWLLDYQLFGSRAGQRQYALPVGTIDVREANFRYAINPPPTNTLPLDNELSRLAFDRNLDTVAVATIEENWLGANYSGIGMRPIHLGINSYGNTTYNLSLQYSMNGQDWVTQQTLPSVSLADKAWQYWQLDGTPIAPFWRVASTDTTVLALREIVLGNVQQDIPLYRMNRDDYYWLPNKDFTSVRALQFYMDRQVSTPIMNMWPVPIDDFQIYFVLIERPLPDVSNLATVLYVPDRWINCIQTALSYKLSLQLPQMDQNRVALLAQIAEQSWNTAVSEERDKSALFIRPNNSYYTR